MSYIRKLILLIILIFANLSLSQDTIILSEGNSRDVCNKILVFDGIWISEGEQFADISILENEFSKPVTGGYKKYDKLEINGCVFYVSNIYKHGIEPAGQVTLVSKEPEKIHKKMYVTVELTNNDRLYSEDESSKIKIYKESKGSAAILAGYKEDGVEKKAVLKKGSVIWYEGYPFELVKISLKRKIAKFLIMKSYSYK